MEAMADTLRVTFFPLCNFQVRDLVATLMILSYKMSIRSVDKLFLYVMLQKVLVRVPSCIFVLNETAENRNGAIMGSGLHYGAFPASLHVHIYSFTILLFFSVVIK
jgi:hypothetical protein